jgi:hypothetical protein
MNQKNAAQILNLVLDSQSYGMKTIDYTHYQIHAGCHFFVRECLSSESGGASRLYVITTPDSSVWAHFFCKITVKAEATVTLTEGITTSDDGTVIPAINRNRNSALTATTIVTHTPTTPTGGTTLYSYSLGHGTDIGGIGEDFTKIILKQHTKYALRILDTSGAANSLDCILNWYEHCDLE